jgi:hypothetical protein
MIESARYVDAEKTTIEAVENGRRFIIPADEGNRHYRLMRDGDAHAGIGPVKIGDYEASPPTDADVDAELERRVTENLRRAERSRLKPKADELKRRRDAGEDPDIKDDAAWNGNGGTSNAREK